MILADGIDPQAIIIFIAVIFAAIKAFLERNQNKPEEGSPPLFEDEQEYVDPYEAYEAELQRQRNEMEIPPPIPSANQPPPLDYPPPSPVVPANVAPVRPKLSKAEKKALENLNLHSPRRGRKSNNSTRARVKRHLSSPTAAREALLLAEILGPPKAFQSQDDRI